MKTKTRRAACALVAVGCVLTAGSGCQRQPPDEPGVNADAAGTAAATETAQATKIVSIADAEHLDSVLTSNKFVLVDFYADWCGPCTLLKPVLEELAGKYIGRVVFAEVDIDMMEDVAREYAVDSIPDVRMFEAGKMVHGLRGRLDKEEYKTAVEELLKGPGPAQ